MIKTILKDQEELKEYFTENYDLSKHIVDEILKNIDEPKKELKIAEILVESDNLIYIVTVEKEDIIITLETQLKNMERFEDFEKCIQIKEAMKKLKK